MTSFAHRPVLAGLEGTPADTAVVRAAVNEARLRARPLRIICARPGESTNALITAAPTAELVVTERAAGERLAAYIRCPLLLVPVPVISSGGPILVAVDATATDATPLLRYGFDAAVTRGVPLRPVFAWTAMSAATASPIIPLDLLAAHNEADRLLAEVLAGWSDKYPDVVVRRDEIRCRAVAPALLRASASASMVIIGARPRPSAGGRTVGSITRTLVRQAPCPVVVIPMEDGHG